MVVHHQNVERERALLLEHRTDSIGNRSLAVEHRNHNRDLHREIALRKVNTVILSGTQITTDALQMVGAGNLHLNLHIALCRIYIIELLLATLSIVILALGICKLLEMRKRAYAAESQTHLIESRIFELCFFLRSILLQGRGAQQHQRTEIKIVSKTSTLIINHRCLFAHTVDNLVAISI